MSMYVRTMNKSAEHRAASPSEYIESKKHVETRPAVPTPSLDTMQVPTTVVTSAIDEIAPNNKYIMNAKTMTAGGGVVCCAAVSSSLSCDEDGCSLSSSAASSSSSLPDDFQIGTGLGEGAFSTVRRASCGSTGKSHAAKFIDVKSAGDLEAAREEYRLNMRLMHQSTSRRGGGPLRRRTSRPQQMSRDETYLVSTNGFFEGDDEACILFDVMEGGSLEQLMLDDGGVRPLGEAEARQVAFNLFTALKAMHKAGIVHRDVKLGNLLVEKPGDMSSVKLGDLGLAHDISRNAWMDCPSGTPKYLAPEVVLTLFDNNLTYSSQVDIWAAGVVMYQLLCGEEPFQSNKPAILFKQIRRQEPNFTTETLKAVSPEAIDFMRRALCKDKHQRITAKQALKHPWLAGIAASRRPWPNSSDSGAMDGNSAPRSLTARLRKLVCFAP